MHATVLFALVSMALVGVGDFVYKRAAVAGAVPSSFLLVQSWFFGATAFFFGVLTGTLRYHPALWLGPLAALSVFAGARMFLHSLRHGEATVNTPIFRLSFAITVALAILFLGEPVSGAFWAAAVLMGIGVWLHLTERHGHEHQHVAMTHSHRHVHDEHHQHDHAFEWSGTGAHSHVHDHVQVRHSHPHFPDIHHRHTH